VRYEHTATLLQNGKVLIAGGDDGTAPVGTRSAELFDPVSGMFTNTGLMNVGRYSHRATLLKNGKVLVTGGSSGITTLNSAELFDPFTGTWTPTEPVPVSVNGHTATLLPNGKVLLAGGVSFTGVTNGALCLIQRVAPTEPGDSRFDELSSLVPFSNTSTQWKSTGRWRRRRGLSRSRQCRGF
jgi:hypothetical protein